MKKVYVIDSNYPEDHYFERADGIITQHVLRALGIRANLKLALDRERFRKAVVRATKAGCDVLHVSTHGNDEGLAVCSVDRDSEDQGFEWPEFVGMFQGPHAPPQVLAMAACEGASSKLAKEFAKASKRPTIIVGSTDKRYPADYVAAWTLLYRHFKRSGVNRGSAQKVLDQICAVVHPNFRYYRGTRSRTATSAIRVRGAVST